MTQAISQGGRFIFMASNNLNKAEVNCETGESIVREFTAEELEEWQSERNRIEAQIKAKEEAAKAKTALLDKLGISEEEAKLLLS